MRMCHVQLTLRQMMAAVAVSALALFDPRLTTLLVIGAGAVLAVGSVLAGSTGGRSRPWAVPYLATLACLYLPFAWVLGDYPWDSYRWHWVKLWPILPGLVAGTFVHPNDFAVTLASGAMSVLLVLMLTSLGTLGRKALVVANGFALVASGLESWLAYQLFLS